MNPPIRLLLCPPDYYGVNYVINPWMEGNVDKVDPVRAAAQWRALVAVLERCAQVELIPPQPGLPDTEMSLLRAQEDCARLLHGAELVLMLASMLHAIGVGNMTPAGVKLVCVDINPAVVTKLADRGSVESVGVVTDVGLFLSRLAQQLSLRDGGGARASEPV